MAETKTRPTRASVDAYLASRARPGQLADCKAIMAMCRRATKQPPKMWGPSMVGFGSYTYRYESGHSGEAFLAGFAVRGSNLVVYLLADTPAQVALRARLGKHSMGKSCLYFKRLADLDVKVLEALIAGSVADVKRRYPTRAKPAPSGVASPPTARDLEALLGESFAAFQALTQRGPTVTREWKRYSKTSPWVLKVSQGDRTLFYVTPQAGSFEATVVLGERATEAALNGRVSKELHASIRGARAYAEGRPVRVVVTDETDLAGVEQLVAVKLDPTSGAPTTASAKRRRG